MRNTVKLLPYIKENVYGHSTTSPQILGWEISKFNINKFWPKTTGKNVKVAVIDTGCDLDHPDIFNNLLPGINLINPRKPPHDDNGHGSHVAGTIAAENNGTGMVGVAPDAKIMPVKALDRNGSGTSVAVANGIVWSANNNADFITMSLGSEKPDKNIYQAIQYATSRGSVIFCAAGNSGPSVDIMYPAKYKETISIGAIDENLERTDFTCAGDSLDFLAPGHNIFSIVPDNGYAMMSGTSMSNPYVVGCACLLLEHMNYKKMSSIDYTRLFKSMTIDLQESTYRNKKYQGYGILAFRI